MMLAFFLALAEVESSWVSPDLRCLLVVDLITYWLKGRGLGFRKSVPLPLHEGPSEILSLLPQIELDDEVVRILLLIKILLTRLLGLQDRTHN